MRRRKLLRVTGGIGIASIAGCTGGDGGDGGDGGSGDGGGQGAATTQQPEDQLPDPADVGEEEYADEWRKVASEKAIEELDGEELVYTTTSRSDFWRESVVQRDFEAPYTALTGKIKPVTGATDAHQQKYIREERSGSGPMSTDLVGFNILAVSGETNFSDLTDIPGYRQAPDNVKLTPFRGSNQIYSYGINYNPELVDEPPETWEDLLDERFADGGILVDFTPPSLIAGATVQTLGESYFEKLKAQKPKMIKSGWGVTKQLGQGAAMASFADQNHHALRAQRSGLSAEYVTNPDVPFWLSKPVGIAARPRHPWAARLYIDFIMRPEHREFQAPRPGTISLDGKLANPEDYELADAFRASGKVWSINDFDMSPADLSKRFQNLVGAPVGG